MTLDLGITRRQRYVSNVTAANITTSTYAQGGTITSYTYSGTTYIAHIFTASGIFTVTSTIYPLEVLAVAGGGGGGSSGASAGTGSGGGGGGGIVTTGIANTINRLYASPAYQAVTTATQANVVGGWSPAPLTDFIGGNGSFQFSWRAVQQTAGGARTIPIPEQGGDNTNVFQRYYLEIAINGIGPTDVAVGLIRDGAIKDGYSNIPYVNLNGGTVNNWTGVGTALGTFAAGDTLQIAIDSSNQVSSYVTYWWVGKNGVWANAAAWDQANCGTTTGTYQTSALRLIFMSAASGGGTLNGKFRSGNENLYTSQAISAGNYGTTITNHSAYYTTPVGLGYISSGTTFGVTVGAGGGAGGGLVENNFGSNGGDTVIYNTNISSFYYSAYFANSYITATNAAFAFGVSDFTIETWIYPTASYGQAAQNYVHPIFNSRLFSGVDVANAGFIVYLDYLNKVGVYTSGTTYLTTVNAVPNAAWSHIAVTRNSNIINVYINGIKDANSFTASGTQNFTNNIVMIGYGNNQTNLGIPQYFQGYLSNYRVVRGLSVYTNNFTPPTTISSATQAAGTNINAITTQTALLTFNTSTIINRSTLTITLNQTSGTVAVSTFAPFNTSSVIVRAFGGGGGGGGGAGSAGSFGNGQVGGSGGGTPGYGGAGAYMLPGAGIPGQGNRGGAGGNALGNGGGGYAYPGGPSLNSVPWSTVGNVAGAGGAGGYFNHSGVMTAYSGGGGGGAWNSNAYAVGLGGVGGGGNGAYVGTAQVNATAGTTNTGGGGGGGNYLAPSSAAAGGSGIVIFRYPAFLGDAARFPTGLTDPYLKNTTLLLSSNRVPTTLAPIYATTASSSAFTVDYLIVGGGGGGGGASTVTGSGGGGGGAGGVVSAVGYTPPGTFNSMYYADSTYGPSGLSYGWTAATDFGNLGNGVWFFSYTGLQANIGAKTSALSETGNYYFEIQITSITGNNANQIGLVRNSIAGYAPLNNVGIYMFDGNTYIGNGSTNVSQSDTRGAFAVNDVLGIAYNPTTNKQWFSRNGVWLIGNDPAVNAGYPITGTGAIVLQIVSGTSGNANNGGIFRRSTQNTYTTPTGFIPYNSIVLTSSTWTITVGSGGDGGTSGASPTSGSSGVNSSIIFSNTNLIAYGGGGGGASYPTSAAGGSGGSGGGGSYNTGGGVISVGQGNVGAPTAAAFSAAGATTSTGYPGGGGGGAGSAGSWTFQSSTGGSGGAGTYTSIISTATAAIAGVGQVVSNLVYFAGGGAGAGISLGTSGSGSGANYTGGGGSGAIFGSASSGSTGSSGVVVIRYPNAQPDATVTPGVATYINTGGYKTYIFTATGTISFASTITYTTSSYISGYLSGTEITNNRTIIDNSYNAVIINTATVTFAQGSFSPYGSNWSTSFNGSTDYIAFVSTVTTGTAFQQNVFWGANKSFTIEAWLNPNANQLSNTATVILGNVQPTGPGLAWSVGLDSSNKPMMYWKDPVNNNNFITATTTLSTGTWNHVAWVANAGTPTIFINGANQFLTTSTISTLTNTTQTYGIVSGAYFNKFYNGSISNLKVSTNALYFPNLSLASSGYFNGSSYLTSATSTAMVFGTSNFTVEFWVFWITVGGAGAYNQVVGKVSSGASVGFGAGSGRWYMTTAVTGYDTGITINTNQWYHVAWVRNSGSVTLYLNGSSSYTTAFATSITDTGFDIGGSSLSGVQYSNVYVSNIRIVNGTAVYTSNFTVPTPNLSNITNTRLLTFLTTSTTFTDYSSTPSLLTASGNPSFSGYTPVNVSSFTLPSAPFNATANTILLTNNAYRHIDSSTSSFAISTGTVTSVPKIQRYSPFSIGYAYNPLVIGGSATFNGFTDYLYTYTATDINFVGTATALKLDSDFTIECWVYTTSTAAQCIFDFAGKDGNTLRPDSFALNIGTTGALSFSYSNTTSPNSSASIVPYTWNHIAVTRVSGFMSIYQNGSLTLIATSSTNFSSGQLTIARNGPTAASFFAGYISDFRIIKGQSVYNGNFNPPVAPLKPIDATTSTSLLLNFNSAAVYDATMQNNVIIVNTATLSTVSANVAKYNSRSMYFPGVADYITVVPTSTSSYALGISDFTVEMWVYLLPTTIWSNVTNLQPATFRSIFDMRTTNVANSGFDIYLGNTGTLNVGTLNLNYITGTTFISVSTWHHIALVKSSNNFNLYLNGLPEGTTYTSAATNFINPTIRIGFGAAGAGYFNGYIDDVRVTRGVARYTSAFLIPQKALPVK